ncbi:MAG: hypothetical protein LBP53_04750 [Candidatus Peribacteria bacterium]|nr:hypothetical protein [Candidatus Peribacteria bacterium]
MVKTRGILVQKKERKKKTALVNVPLIEARAEEIDKRLIFGHWEVDMIVLPK